MDTHPKNAPLCFVEPTVDMQINVNMFVDHNGKVYLPYLHDWQPVRTWAGIIPTSGTGLEADSNIARPVTDARMYLFSRPITLSMLSSVPLQQESDIVSLIQVMTITFSENPPVFSKPKNPKPQYRKFCVRHS